MSSFRERHKCREIARISNLAPGREVWVGELLEQDPAHPIETHCLHVITPENDVVFGLYSGDAGCLAIIAQILHGTPINQRWLETMEAHSRHNTEKLRK